MNIDNVFFFKKIVDNNYPDENISAVQIQPIVIELERLIQEKSDPDFEEILISCFIPDLYSGMGKREKLFTKLTELMVGEWWRRIGGTYRLPTKKSGTEDVELMDGNRSIVCDAKVFRLGRSQKAPNVKDFLKIGSVRSWIEKLSEASDGKKQILGGLVTYSSLHEWEKDSEVYEECTNPDTPVVMLPYEVLALLLKYKNRFSLQELEQIWYYSSNKVKPSRVKSNYWEYIKRNICKIIKITAKEYDLEIRNYHQRILKATAEYRKIIKQAILEKEKSIKSELSQFNSRSELEKHAINMIVNRDNAEALDYLKHIDDFRKYNDVD